MSGFQRGSVARTGIGIPEVGVLVAVIALPLAGAIATGRDAREFFVFPPPLAIPTDYPKFLWSAAGAVIVALGILGAGWWRGAKRAQALPIAIPAAPHTRGRWPAWGWLALAWTLAAWALAWTRLEWFAPWQRYTFFPLWLGFIVTVNAATYARTGQCLMTRAPGVWAILFVASAGFWWLFEWLNRFVRNWHYLAIEEFGPVAYALHATLCFSTVLPAVAAVAEWLQTFSRWHRATAAGWRWPWLSQRGSPGWLAAGGAAALFATGAWPGSFYPALWVAPLALLLASTLHRVDSSVQDLVTGNWTRVAAWMIGALICGFFWELWNWHSLAKWIYTVPGVERWHVFEMPLLGYAGYLPFGVECLLVAERILGPRDDRPG